MELIVKLTIDDTTNSGMLPGAPKDGSIKLADHCLHIINNKQILNVLKCSTKIQNIESLFKYQ